MEGNVEDTAPQDVPMRTPEPQPGATPSVVGKARAGAVTVVIDDINGHRKNTGPAEGEQ
jgi:hypothetical protein